MILRSVRALLGCSVLLYACPGLNAQTVLTVGSGPGNDYSNLRDAACDLVTAVGPFVLELDEDGSPYAGFELDRSGVTGTLDLTIRPKLDLNSAPPMGAVRLIVEGNDSIVNCGVSALVRKAINIVGDGPSHTIVRLEGLIVDRDATSTNDGGIGVQEAHVQIDNCEVRNAIDSGLKVDGDLSPEGASALVRRSLFRDNSDGSRGGAIYQFDESVVELEGCVFFQNTADEGGACHIGDSNGSTNTLVASNCRYEANVAPGAGGAIFCADLGSMTIKKTGFLLNVAGPDFGDGGAVRALAPRDAVFKDCVFDGNLADNPAPAGRGGALFFNLASNLSATPVLTNCLFANNQARLGGGVYQRRAGSSVTSFMELENCTLADNTATSGGGLYVDTSSTATVEGSLIWNNAPSGVEGSGAFVAVAPNINQDTSSSDPDFSSGRGEPFPGALALGEDPAVYTTPDYYLDPGSPAVNPSPAQPQTCGSGADDFCIRTTDPGEFFDDDSNVDLGFHYRAPLPGTHTAFATSPGDEIYSVQVGSTLDFTLRLGPPTADKLPGTVRQYIILGSATPTPWVFNGLNLGVFPDSLTTPLFNAVQPSSIGNLDDLANPEGIVDLSLFLPVLPALVDLPAIYLTGWSLEQQQIGPNVFTIHEGPYENTTVNRVQIQATR